MVAIRNSMVSLWLRVMEVESLMGHASESGVASRIANCF